MFELGVSPHAGSTTPATSISRSASGELLNISARFEDLLPSTTYYYRVLSSNADGSGEGSEESFTTSGVPGTLVLPTTPAPVPYLQLAVIAKQEGTGGPTPLKTRVLTKQEKLARAVKACVKRPKRQRPACLRAAKRAFGPAKPHKSPRS
jgi:hypothetical protein